MTALTSFKHQDIHSTDPVSDLRTPNAKIEPNLSDAEFWIKPFYSGNVPLRNPQVDYVLLSEHAPSPLVR
jgi:hypothetical protein